MIALLFGSALAQGFSAETTWASAWGPDQYLSLELLGQTDSLEAGALWLAGTQPGLLALTAKHATLGPLAARMEARLGMLSGYGPTAGAGLDVALDTGSVTPVVQSSVTPGLGWELAGGVDAGSDKLLLRPRLSLDTLAGERDPAIRVELGLRLHTRSLWLELAVSGGGRDVLHMGPGATLAFGRNP